MGAGAEDKLDGQAGWCAVAAPLPFVRQQRNGARQEGQQLSALAACAAGSGRHQPCKAGASRRGGCSSQRSLSARGTSAPCYQTSAQRAPHLEAHCLGSCTMMPLLLRGTVVRDHALREASICS